MASSSTSFDFLHKRFKYDVFLSFRGEDTRTNFIDHLYHALQQKSFHTYKDDEKIKKGRNICEELIGSIEDSKFYVIVFSKNYASSSWCLDELVKIMECHKTTEHRAYPVFYDVEPSEVRNQTGAVGKAFTKHENKENARKWREALKEAADLAGWELKNTADRHEAKFIQKIVEELSVDLRAIDYNIDEKLIGMQTRINDVLSSLGSCFDDVCMIGIKGIGGGGKTTLARAVFDHISHQFEGKSFVENVREVSKASLSGLKSLQNQILSNVLNDQGISASSIHDGKNMMKRWMPNKKVLLVLDDVDHIEQLEALAGETNWFKPGSRIVITTRDEQVLVAHGVKSIHNLQLLSNQEAIHLFSRYAFGKVIPNQGYEVLSQEVVHYAAGLPLTIKVLGSFLRGTEEPEWRDALNRLKTIPLMETLKKLEISYISLEEDYKEIFLDVACLLKGWLKDNAIKALESCGFNARNGLRVLEQKSLITVNDGFLGMHDHIEEMGKNIVRRSHPDEPYKHSRLWINKEIEDILTNDLGSAATRCIKFNTWNLSPETVMKGLGKMKKLRFLDVSRQSIDAITSDCSHRNWKFNKSSALRYLCWNHYPFRSLPRTFLADNLVSLEMAHSKIIQLWGGGERKVFKKLRFLDLSYSELRTLDLGSASNLELLDLGGCSDLVELHMPGISPNLRSLKLGNSKLRTLDIGLTPNLEYLDLQESCYLEQLHMANDCLKNLVYINLNGCLRYTSFMFHVKSDAYGTDNESLKSGPLAELHLIAESVDGCTLHPDNNLPKFRFTCFIKDGGPLLTSYLEKLISVGLCACTNLDTLRSICGLKRIIKLQIEGNIPKAPKDLDQLELLKELDLSYTKIKHPTDKICLLKHLRSVKLSCSLLEKLPEDLGRLKCLEYLESLELYACSFLERLPDDIGRLECLKKLSLRSAKIKDLPDSICMLKHLHTLELNDCSLLEKLPEDLGRLECLENLNLGFCTLLRDIPDSIHKLKCLKHLNLDYCIQLEKLPELLGHLKCLEELDLKGTRISHLPRSIFLLKGLRIVASKGFLESCGFTSEIQILDYETFCYVKGREVSNADFERTSKKAKNN